MCELCRPLLGAEPVTCAFREFHPPLCEGFIGTTAAALAQTLHPHMYNRLISSHALNLSLILLPVCQIIDHISFTGWHESAFQKCFVLGSFSWDCVYIILICLARNLQSQIVHQICVLSKRKA